MSETVVAQEPVVAVPAAAARSTVAMGWLLFALALAVFGLTFLVALAYLALD